MVVGLLLASAAKGSGVPPGTAGWSGGLHRRPPAADTWMSPERALPRGPAAARAPCPRRSQGAQRRFTVSDPGMKAAASASRRRRAAERAGPGCSPVSVLAAPAAGWAGSGSGAEQVRSGLSRRCVHAAASLSARQGEIRARSFNTQRDAAAVVSHCPAGSDTSPAVPPPVPATLVRFVSLRTCHQLYSASSSQPSTVPYGSGLFWRGRPGAMIKIHAVIKREENPERCRRNSDRGRAGRQGRGCSAPHRAAGSRLRPQSAGDDGAAKEPCGKLG